MHITPIKTKKITHPADSLVNILDQYLPLLKEQTIVAITSKLVSICQGDVVKNDGKINKKKLIHKEADYFLNHEPYPGIVLTINNNILIPSAGIDESNANGYFVLWPKNIQKTTNAIREHIKTKHKVEHIGVIITDSHTTMLRRGTTGIGIAYSGFTALKDYRGTNDLFGKKLMVTSSNIFDGLATAATVVMGEGTEQTPIAIIEDIPHVHFQNQNPTKQELDDLMIEPEKDLYAPLIDIKKWNKGGNKNL